VTTDFTGLFKGLAHGDAAALGQIVSALYGELHQIAHARLRRGEAPTLLDTTSLVHESYLRLLRTSRIRVEDRSHFLAYAAHTMRSVVVDFVRESAASRQREKIAGQDALEATRREVLLVHEALESLAEVSPRLATIVEMRYFAGLTEVEVADALGLNERTVRRDWQKARLFLASVLNAPGESQS
jgi:RNA polymerase sigma factor (TIGR02999 family)